MLTTVGWCAGRPADHELRDERMVAEVQWETYPGTTAARDFRGSTAPAANWWTTQTLGAVGALWDPARDLPVDVVLSWDVVNGRSLAPLLTAAPEWVGTVHLLGRHEPEAKITAEQHLIEFRWLRTKINELRDQGMKTQVKIGPAYILYRARDPLNRGTADDVKRFCTPLVEEDLIDFIAWDGYPSNPLDAAPSKPSTYEDPAEFSALPQAWRADTGLPYAWAELGHERVPRDPDGVGAARWFAGVYRQARADGALFVTLFHYNKGDLVRPGGPTALPRRAELEAWRHVTAEANACHYAFAAGIEAGRAESTIELAEAFARGRQQGWTSALEQGMTQCGSALAKLLFDGPGN